MCRKRFHYPNSDSDSDGGVQDEGTRRRCKCCSREVCRDSLQIVLMLLGLVCGVALGIYLRHVPPLDQPRLHPIFVTYVGFPGELLRRFLMMLCLPLIASSLISAFGVLNATSSARLGCCTLLYYVITTCVSAAEGFAWVYAVRPGGKPKMAAPTSTGDPHTVYHADIIMDLLRNLFPDNIMTMSKTERHWMNLTVDDEDPFNSTHLVESYREGRVEAVNVLGVSMVAIMFGVALASLKHPRRLVEVVHVVFEATMVILNIMIWFYPAMIASLVADRVLLLDDPIRDLQDMAVFVGTVIGALLCHMIIVMPLIYVILARRNPFKLLLNVMKALVTAFATGNSTITLPVTLDCLECKAGVSPVVSRLVCPIGATVNMDGSVLYEVMAVMFVTMLRGHEPGPLLVLTLGSISVLLSIGARTVGNGPVVYTILFQVMGLPLEDIAILLMFDWLLARFSTATNVWSDCVGTGIIERFSQNALREVAERREAARFDSPGEEPNHNIPLKRHRGNTYTITMRNEEDEIMKVSRL